MLALLLLLRVGSEGPPVRLTSSRCVHQMLGQSWAASQTASFRSRPGHTGTCLDRPPSGFVGPETNEMTPNPHGHCYLALTKPKLDGSTWIKGKNTWPVVRDGIGVAWHLSISNEYSQAPQLSCSSRDYQRTSRLRLGLAARWPSAAHYLQLPTYNMGKEFTPF